MPKDRMAKVYQRLGNASDVASSFSFGMVALFEENPVLKGLFTFICIGKSIYTGARFHEYGAAEVKLFDDVKYLQAFDKYDFIYPLVGGILLSKGIYDSINGRVEGLYNVSLGSSLVASYMGDYFRDNYISAVKDIGERGKRV